MSIISFPTVLNAARLTWGQQRQDIEFRSMLGAQAVEVNTPLWIATLNAPVKNSSDFGVADYGAWQSLMMQLKGRTNQLALHNLARPAPLGTMRGAMTFGVAVNAGDTTLNISASGQAATTLRAGDYLGMGSATTQQVVMVMADATADGSGNIVVTVQPPVRNAFTLGTSVVWDKPQVLFRRKDSTAQWNYDPTTVSGLVLNLIEDWRT